MEPANAPHYRKQILALKKKIDEADARGHISAADAGSIMLTDAACSYPEEPETAVQWLLYVAEKVIDSHIALRVCLASGMLPREYYEAFQKNGWKCSHDG